MSLGIIENPMSNTKSLHLDNAKMLIDDLERLIGDLSCTYETVEAQGGAEPQ